MYKIEVKDLQRWIGDSVRELVVVAVDEQNRAVIVPLSFVQDAADHANYEAEQAHSEAEGAAQAHLDADTSRNAIEAVFGAFQKFSDEEAYEHGSIVAHEGALYRFVEDHEAGAWSVADVEQVSVVMLNKEATEAALDAAGKALEQAEYAKGEGDTAHAKAVEADTAARIATEKAVDADNAAGRANASAELADGKAELANTAAENANIKADAAQEAAGMADEKARLANEKAELADTNAKLANEKAELAEQKAGLADTKAGEANMAAVYANREAGLARQAKEDANEAAEDTRAATEAILAAIATLVPTGMSVEYPERITMGNVEEQRIKVDMNPEHSPRNVVFISDNSAVAVAPDGRITVLGVGHSTVHVVPTANASLYKTLVIQVSNPVSAIAGGNYKLLGDGAMRMV